MQLFDWRLHRGPRPRLWHPQRGLSQTLIKIACCAANGFGAYIQYAFKYFSNTIRKVCSFLINVWVSNTSFAKFLFISGIMHWCGEPLVNVLWYTTHVGQLSEACILVLSIQEQWFPAEIGSKARLERKTNQKHVLNWTIIRPFHS